MMASSTLPQQAPSGIRNTFSIQPYMERGPARRIRPLSNTWMTDDPAKTTIVDRKVAIVGGMNIVGVALSGYESCEDSRILWPGFD